MPSIDALLSFILGPVAGFALAYAYIHMVESVARYERNHATPPPPPTPNALQRAVYASQTATRPVDRPQAQPPVKRGPGRPRKQPEQPLEQTVRGGRRVTRSYAVSEK